MAHDHWPLWPTRYVRVELWRGTIYKARGSAAWDEYYRDTWLRQVHSFLRTTYKILLSIRVFFFGHLELSTESCISFVIIAAYSSICPHAHQQGVETENANGSSLPRSVASGFSAQRRYPYKFPWQMCTMSNLKDVCGTPITRIISTGFVLIKDFI